MSEGIIVHSDLSGAIDFSAMKLATEAFNQFERELDQSSNHDFSEFLKEKTMWE